MKRAIAIAILFLFAPLAVADDKLAEKLVLEEVQGGFAGFTGKQWTIDTAGKWEEATLFRQKATVVRSGTLGKKELATLIAEVKKYDPATLKSEGKAGANPRVVGVGYGKSMAKLTLGTGADLPKPDAKTNSGRFAGIAAAVKAAIPTEKKKE